MIAIARGIDRFDGRAAFSTWCYRVATNAALDELRRTRRRPVPAHPDAPEPVRPARPRRRSWPRGSTSTPRSRTLPEEFRVAVVLRDLCDLDYAEIAEVLDVPPGTVRSRISRGRAILVERSDPRRPASGPAPQGTRTPRRTSERRWLTTSARRRATSASPRWLEVEPLDDLTAPPAGRDRDARTTAPTREPGRRRRRRGGGSRRGRGRGRARGRRARARHRDSGGHDEHAGRGAGPHRRRAGGADASADARRPPRRRRRLRRSRPTPANLAARSARARSSRVAARRSPPHRRPRRRPASPTSECRATAATPLVGRSRAAARPAPGGHGRRARARARSTARRATVVLTDDRRRHPLARRGARRSVRGPPPLRLRLERRPVRVRSVTTSTAPRQKGARRGRLDNRRGRHAREGRRHRPRQDRRPGAEGHPGRRLRAARRLLRARPRC